MKQISDIKNKWHNYDLNLEDLEIKKPDRVTRGNPGPSEHLRRDLPELIVDELIVCKVCGVAPGEIFGVSRRALFTYTRHVCWYMLYKYPWFTYEKIGERYGTHYTTVLAGIRGIKDTLIYADHRERLEYIEEEIEKQLK